MTDTSIDPNVYCRQVRSLLSQLRSLERSMEATELMDPDAAESLEHFRDELKLVRRTLASAEHIFRAEAWQRWVDMDDEEGAA